MELVRTGLACLVALVTATAPSAQRTVNAPLAPGIVGDVAWHAISPDGARVVYTADQEINAHVELYSVPSAGGPAVKLNISRPGLTGSSISLVEVTSDATRVVFLHGGDLYVVPIAGGPALQLNAEEGAGSRASRFQVSADLQRVVYWSLYEDFHGLFSVPIGGGPIVTIEARKVSGFEISPDATRIVFERLSNGHLYSAPIGGGTVTQLTSALHGRIARFEISPDSSRVVYVGYGDTNGVDELYSVPIAGGAMVKLNPPLPPGGDVGNQSQQRDFVVGPSSRVVYFADQVTDGVMELFSVPIAGGVAVRLNADLVAGSDVESAQIAVDSVSGAVRVLYTTRQDAPVLSEVFSVPIGGGSAVSLSGPQNGVIDVELAPDGRRVVYLATLPASADFGAYSVPVAGGVPLRIDQTPAGGSVGTVLVSPDSARVAYEARLGPEPEDYRLWTVPITGGNAVRLDAPLADPTDVLAYSFTPASDHVVFRADLDHTALVELFSVSITGGENVQLNPQLAPSGIAGDVSGYAVSEDGRRAVYLADGDEDELYGARPGSGTPYKINGLLDRGGDVTDFALSPDGLRTLYIADQEQHGTFELYACNTDDPAPVKISPPMVANGDVVDLRLSPTGARVVYRADRFVDERFELFSTDGISTVKLNMELGPDRRVGDDFAISDEGRVVYRVIGPPADELHSVSIAGGASTRLNGSLPINGDVDMFRITPEGGRVVYLADGERNNVYEIFSVPVQGGTPVRLSGPMIGDGDAFGNFQIAGSIVVYIADQDTDEVWELYSVPVQGGVPTKLNGPLQADEDVSFNFALSPAGTHVLLNVSGPGTFDPHALYVVPAAGGTPVLLETNVHGGSNDPFAFSPDSQTVVFRRSVTSGWPPLYSVPVAGGAPVLLGFAGAFWILSDSSQVLYTGVDGDEGALLLQPIGGGAARRIAGPLGWWFRELRFAGDRVLYMDGTDEDDVVELFSASLTRKGSLAPWPAPAEPGGD